MMMLMMMMMMVVVMTVVVMMMVPILPFHPLPSKRIRISRISYHGDGQSEKWKSVFMATPSLPEGRMEGGHDLYPHLPPRRKEERKP